MNNNFSEDLTDGLDPSPEEIRQENWRILDDYIKNVRQDSKADKIIALADYDNLSRLMDYLTDRAARKVAELNEFDLRWFLYVYSIKSSELSEEIAALKILPDSLYRFFTYLAENASLINITWILDILSDKNTFLQRLSRYDQIASIENEDIRDRAYLGWTSEIEIDFDNRALLLPREIEDGMLWSDSMGWREASLWSEAHTAWLQEREDLIQSGHGIEAVRDQLLYSYQMWLASPQERLEEDTPLQVILAEREENETDMYEEEIESDY